MKRDLIVIAHNLRSCHNVGALLRTAEGLGVKCVYLTGYSPYPEIDNDQRLPHIRHKLTKQIQKTALGAEQTLTWEQSNDVFAVISQLKLAGYTIIALEQTPSSIDLPDYQAPDQAAIILGEEVTGIESAILEQADIQIEIPMLGTKESFNVVQAAAMALYHFRFI